MLYLLKQWNLMDYHPVKGGGFVEEPVKLQPAIYNPLVIAGRFVAGWCGVNAF